MKKRTHLQAIMEEPSLLKGIETNWVRTLPKNRIYKYIYFLKINYSDIIFKYSFNNIFYII